ncbi:POK6 protein, partial [Poecile atricapillus]|nr:POK6 protein [Poecile atricapillus]
DGSPQMVELAAIVRAFSKFTCPFNMVTDSAYVTAIVKRGENSFLKTVTNDPLYMLLKNLTFLLSQRQRSYFVLHICSHNPLPGPLTEGNEQPDTLAMIMHITLPNIFKQAKLNHSFFHQNAPALHCMLKITKNQAKVIVTTCPDCQKHSLWFIRAGVNPRGLQSLQIWQSDVTHYASFGKFKYLHVSSDTFSGAVFASAHVGEAARDAIKHILQAFTTQGIPHVKNKRSAYISHKLQQFYNIWGIKHTTSIPHSPTGQSIVERAHRSLKRILGQQKGR